MFKTETEAVQEREKLSFSYQNKTKNKSRYLESFIGDFTVWEILFLGDHGGNR